MINLNSPFPITALTPKLQNVVADIHRESNAPIPSIVAALLTAMSLVCQGKVRIRKRAGLISPVSLWFIVVLASGERKSSVMKIILKAIEDFSLEMSEMHRHKMEGYADKLTAWRAELKGILASIRRKAERNEATDDEHSRLDEHNLRKPQKPKQFKLLHEKMTPQALIKNLCECFPTTGLISDEAVCVFSSRGLSDFGTLNKGWDGSTISVERASEESVVISDPCLTLALYVQHEIIEAFFNGKGESARPVGFLSRCYFVNPPGTAGSRFLAYSSGGTPHPAVDDFHERCKEILRSHISEKEQDLPEKIELVFSPDAQIRWEREHDQIELMMNPGGFFFNDKDFASKHADKIARLAAIIHYFEGGNGPISLDVLNRSIEISAWFANEFVRNFAKPQQLPQEFVDAQKLLCWLADFIRTSGQFIIKKNDILHSGPNSLRNKIRLNAALIVIWQQGIVWERKFTDDKTVYIEMRMEYFTPFQIQCLCAQGMCLS